MDIKRRDEIIFGSYDPEQYFGGGIRFIEHLNYSQLKTQRIDIMSLPVLQSS